VRTHVLGANLATAARASLNGLDLFRGCCSVSLPAHFTDKRVSQMMIGQRLRELRESKSLSQGDIEKRTGMLRCYTSRVENGHTVPSVDTLEKYARALEIPMYRLFYEGDKPPQKPKLPTTRNESDRWGATGKERDELRAFAKALARMNDGQRKLLLVTARWMARGNRGR
jgi:transcriptional regulator with XRE-family HTH domain